MGSGLDTTLGTRRSRRILLDLWAVLWVDCGRRVSLMLVNRGGQIKRSLEFTNPILLEAVLRAEKAVLNIKLQARWALERSSLVWAVCADAHALLLCGCGHIVGDGGVDLYKTGYQIYILCMPDLRR